MKTKTEIILETRDAYKNPANRGIGTDGNCEYLGAGKTMCALGRCMIAPKNYTGSLVYLKILNGENVENFQRVLKPKYRGHCEDFWVDVQNWHDTDSNFNKKAGKISIRGTKEMNKLLKKYENQ